MIEAPIPYDEVTRLELLKACKIMYTPAEEAFDDVARLAADLCGTEIALITLVDSDYQWFKARVGIEQTGTPRDLSFCGHTDACSGLVEVHELGVVHRDLKPSNVFLAECGRSRPVVKVVDFGIAAGDPSLGRPTTKLTTGESPLGSPPYMSPEQMLGGDVDARTDVWSMGALLYETITGHLPFPGETELQTFAAVMTRPPLPMRAHMTEPLPSEVEGVLLKCLRKDRADRYESMNALATALRLAASA
jgi:serine/threonine protein kinase